MNEQLLSVLRGDPQFLCLASGDIQCDTCDIFLPNAPKRPCPNCGSVVRRHSMKLEDGFMLVENVGLRAKHANATGKRKWHWELKDGYEFSRDGSGKLVYKFRLIDRENDYYCEVVLDARTREVFVAQSHPLSNHVGHGSARKIVPPVEIGLANEEQLNTVLLWLAEEAEENGEGFHCHEKLIRSAQSEGAMLCALIDGEAIAFLTFSRKALAQTAAIDCLEVHPAHRRKGIGKRLTNFVTTLLSSEGREAVTVICAPRSSEAFWGTLGFMEYDSARPGEAPRLSLTLSPSSRIR